MMRTLFSVDHDNEGAFRRNRDEVGVRHRVSFAADGLNFVRGEGNGAIELANGLYNHAQILIGDPRLINPGYGDGAAQFGGRFSLKAAMPSFASADSRASKW